MKNKKNIILVVSFVVVIIISFYAGSIYTGLNSKKINNLSQGVNQFSQNGKFGQTRSNSMGQRANGGNIFGQIIAKDANSITVELKAPNNQNGTNQTTGTGSKIIFYTTTTTVTKQVNGTLDDLTVGKNVNIIGTVNTDGSVSANSVQIR